MMKLRFTMKDWWFEGEVEADDWFEFVDRVDNGEYPAEIVMQDDTVLTVTEED